MLFSLAAVDAPQRRPRLLPVDQAASDSKLLAVRTKLLEVLSTHDFGQVMTFVADDVRFQGIPGSVKRLVYAGLPNGAGDRTLAEHLIRALSLGGSFTTTRGSAWGEREFCAPYVYSAFPRKFDNLFHSEAYPSVIVTNHVPLRSTPDPDALARRFLSYDIVGLRSSGGNASRDRQGRLWNYEVIEEPLELKGFIPRESVRNPGEYHVCFGLRSGEWRITEIMDNVFPSYRDTMPDRK